MGNRLNDHEAHELVSGVTPSERPELGELAELITDLREASATLVAPAPSAQLGAILDGRLVAPVSQTDGVAVAPSTIAVAATAPAGARAALITGVRTMIKWPSGLELPSKIALGAGLVVAAATGVGAAGALPGPVQSAFDIVASQAPDLTGEGEASPPSTDDDKAHDGFLGADPHKPVGDPTPAPSDKPKDQAPLPSDTPKDPAPAPSDKPKDPAPLPSDKPKDPAPLPSDKPKDPTPAPTDKPKDPTPPPTDKPTDPTPAPTDKPTDPTPAPTDKPTPEPTGEPKP